MKNCSWIPKTVLSIVIVMIFCFSVLAEDPDAGPSTVVPELSEPVAKAVAPPITEIVTRYSSKNDTSDLVTAFRPTITGRDFVITGPHHSVTQVAYDVMMRGGNFWDAAAAAMWMAELLGGQMTAGTAPFTIWNAEEGKAYSYCGVGPTGALGTIDWMINKWGDSIKTPAGFSHVPDTPASRQGPDAQYSRANVAATPDNIFALLIRFGSMSFTECYQEVLEHMDKGWPLRTTNANFIRTGDIFREPKLSMPAFAANRALWGQNGRDAKPGDLLKEPGLARTIRAMMKAEQEALAAGASREEALKAARDWYYTGPIAEAVDQIMRENDGILRYADYADYQGYWTEQKHLPQTNFMGVDFYTDPTYTQAGVLVLVLNILDNFDLVSLGWNTPKYLHLLTQAFDLAMSDRWQWFGDPHFTDIPDALWSKEYGTLRASLIDMNSRFQEVPPAGDPFNMNAVLEGWEPFVTPEQAALAWGEFDMTDMLAEVPGIDENNDEFRGDTNWMSMIDSEGNLFTYCPSDGRNNDSSQIPGWGVGIPRRGRQFTLDARYPSHIEPGKRPVSTPHTWVASINGEGYLAVQSPGGDLQIQSALPILLNHLVWGMPLQVAIDQPRVATHNVFSMFTPYIAGRYYPGTTEVDAELPEEVIKGLQELGHKIRMGSKWAVGSQPQMVLRDPDTGLVYGASSVNNETYVFGR